MSNEPSHCTGQRIGLAGRDNVPVLAVRNHLLCAHILGDDRRQSTRHRLGDHHAERIKK
jgi:hypothetical protein